MLDKCPTVNSPSVKCDQIHTLIKMSMAKRRFNGIVNSE